MKKYRIAQCGNQFFPEYQNCLGFWRNYTESNGYYNEDIAFSTKDGAFAFLDKQSREDKAEAAKPKVKSTLKIIHPWP